MYYLPDNIYTRVFKNKNHKKITKKIYKYTKTTDLYTNNNTTVNRVTWPKTLLEQKVPLHYKKKFVSR